MFFLPRRPVLAKSVKKARLWYVAFFGVFLDVEIGPFFSCFPGCPKKWLPPLHFGRPTTRVTDPPDHPTPSRPPSGFSTSPSVLCNTPRPSSVYAARGVSNLFQMGLPYIRLGIADFGIWDFFEFFEFLILFFKFWFLILNF